MFAMITLVATLVHVFSIGYMREDKRFPRFFTYLGLFCFSMLGLVIGGTMLQLFIFWELVGLCSLPADRLLVREEEPRATPPSRRSSPTASATSAS